MGLKLGSTDIADVKLGSSQVSAIYQGANKVWPAAVPTFIGAATAESGTGTNWVCDVSGIDIQAGDTIILLVSSGLRNSPRAITPAVTELAYDQDGGFGVGIYIREADGTETTFSETNNNQGNTVCCVVHRNVVYPPLTGNRSKGFSGAPNPPERTGIAAGSIILALGGCWNQDDPMNPQAEYVMRATIGTVSFWSTSSALSELTREANATENPDRFSGVNNKWFAWTVELQAA